MRRLNLRTIPVLMAIALAAAACSPATGGTAPSSGTAGERLTITSRDMVFDKETLTVVAGTPFSLELINEDGAPHNVAIYTDETATEGIFIGELITSSAIVYEIPALEAGTYHFRCDLHPEMAGTLVVGEVPPASN